MRTVTKHVSNQRRNQLTTDKKEPAIPEGFIRHTGNKCPVAGDVRVETMLGDGERDCRYKADMWSWHNDGSLCNRIIAYRVIEPLPSPMEEEPSLPPEPTSTEAGEFKIELDPRYVPEMGSMDGWRFMEHGEVLKDGDEVWQTVKIWHETAYVGFKVGFDTTHLIYRRKIEQPAIPETPWQPKPGEIVFWCNNKFRYVGVRNTETLEPEFDAWVEYLDGRTLAYAAKKKDLSPWFETVEEVTTPSGVKVRVTTTPLETKAEVIK